MRNTITVTVSPAYGNQVLFELELCYTEPGVSKLFCYPCPAPECGASVQFQTDAGSPGLGPPAVLEPVGDAPLTYALTPQGVWMIVGVAVTLAAILLLLLAAFAVRRAWRARR